MKYSLRSSFARQMLVLLVLVLLLTVLGRVVTVTGAAALCSGWPICLPLAPLGWVQFAHRFLVALAAALMLQILRKAWREQRDNIVLLPLTTVTAVLFFGQAFIGALGATNGYPRHLAILHGLTATSLWIALAVLTFVSGVIARDPVDLPKADRIQRLKDFFALTKPLIVGLLLMTTIAGLMAGYGG